MYLKLPLTLYLMGETVWSFNIYDTFRKSKSFFKIHV